MYLEQVFNPDEVELYSNEIDRIRPIPGYEPDQNPDTPHGHYAWMDHTPDLDPGGFMDRRELLSYGPAIIDLIDKAPVFDYVVELMGPNILLCMSQVIVRAPNEKFPGYTQDGIDKPILQWSEHAPCGLRPRVRAARGRAHCSLTIPSWGYTHTDGGASLRQIRVSEGCPPIALKAMWLLSDVTEEDSGNLPIFSGQPPSPDSRCDHPLLTRRCPIDGQSWEPLSIYPLPVARSGEKPCGSSPQDPALQLVPALGSLLRL